MSLYNFYNYKIIQNVNLRNESITDNIDIICAHMSRGYINELQTF